jgi:protein phosphatase
VVFVLLVLGVIGGAAGATVWYARASYFVGLDGDQVAIYKGRPGGLLWFDPTLEQRTSIPKADIPPAVLPAIEAGREEPTLADAKAYVANLKDQIDKLKPPPTTTTTTTTTTLPVTPPATAPAPAPN